MKPDGSSGAAKVGAAIPNIDSVKATIRTCYGATSEGIADKTKSPYITEINKLLNDQTAYLAQNAKAAAKPAIVLDVDDTTLWNYDKAWHAGEAAEPDVLPAVTIRSRH